MSPAIDHGHSDESARAVALPREVEDTLRALAEDSPSHAETLRAYINELLSYAAAWT